VGDWLSSHAHMGESELQAAATAADGGAVLLTRDYSAVRTTTERTVCVCLRRQACAYVCVCVATCTLLLTRVAFYVSQLSGLSRVWWYRCGAVRAGTLASQLSAPPWPTGPCSRQTISSRAYGVFITQDWTRVLDIVKTS
jgi:hypothetical protein